MNGLLFFFLNHEGPEKFSCFFQACDLTCNVCDSAYSFSVSWNWEGKDTTVQWEKSRKMIKFFQEYYLSPGLSSAWDDWQSFPEATYLLAIDQLTGKNNDMSSSLWKKQAERGKTEEEMYDFKSLFFFFIGFCPESALLKKKINWIVHIL